MIEEEEQSPPSYTPDEEYVLNWVSNFTDVYNAQYPDDKEQKDFSSKMLIMTAKLGNHEVKPNLLKLVIDFAKSKLFLKLNN